MKLRRTLRFHGLKKPRVRQTWNKYNLFNLANDRQALNTIGSNVKTFFQQKWAAKRLARGYHGEHIKERAWERMFDRRLLSVVNMEPRYMAQYDGSEQASGRGQGKAGSQESEILEKQRGSGKKTPYMQMAFAPMERRLDIAVFRALFASSARQARQFCVHGAVKVNGKRMKYPGYLLNPGDMFQVDPERVLFATGAKKDPAAVADALKPAEDSEAAPEAEASSDAEPPAEGEPTPEGASAAEPTEPAAAPEDPAKAERAELKALRDRVKGFLKTSFGDLSAKQKQSLRALSKDIKTAISKTKGGGEDIDGLSTLFSQLEVDTKEAESNRNAPDAEVDEQGLTRSERERLSELLAEESENPWDPDKPYATPWRPRPFMAPFVFIPRYLEVNQKICSAVYLRHPVARAGKAEVPSPYGELVNELAFNWYLRRR
ncbi:alpha-L RNA-binding motif-containing protein [Coniochaeta ligniaria NRRL 30616]|uniref:Small ribosomal subunit protein uS4m n=1 Tax=Coniochaeta ligniaria NRRL 30616 TaxID=1408157 RepID=A0A1J7JPT5_9PEZI|nr:alpha-L RNA-binding motif-containing protein [Coniochaeta ligniaria NRRL 30616]